MRWWEMELLRLLGVILACCLDVLGAGQIGGTNQQHRKGYEENLFHNVTYIEEYAVRCENVRPSPTDRYPEETWTCHNMTINQQRLMHVFPSGFAGGGCGDDLGHRYRNQIHKLCEDMLAHHQVQKKVWAALVQDATCKDSVYGRMMYVRNRAGRHRWLQVPPGKGYARSLRCMTE